MKKLPYWRRWMKTALGGAWTSYNTTRAITAIVVPLILSPFIKQYIPALEPYMSDLLWQIPSAALGLFFAGRVFLTPGWLDREQEQEIQKLKKQLHDRDRLHVQCDAIADLIDEGRRVQKLYAEGAVAPDTDESAAWQEKVRTYLQENFGHVSVIQWENNRDLDLPESPPPRRALLIPARQISYHPPSAPIFSSRSKNSHIRLILNVRLTRLHELLEKLQKRSVDLVD